METNEVERHYSAIARELIEEFDRDRVCGHSSCCEPALTAGEAAFLYAQESLRRIPQAAQVASRGCGDPIAKARIMPGQQVLDLGSGGGIDALIAARIVGEDGHVYGIDMTADMVELARHNAAQAGVANVEFIHGRIEELPLPSESIDTVISNCVINFSDDKEAILREAYRVLAPGGKLVLSDIVAFRTIAPSSYEPLCRIVGCTNGISLIDAYRESVCGAGFTHVEVEPKTIYTREVLEQKALQKGRMDSFALLADDASVGGASGSVIVAAYR